MKQELSELFDKRSATRLAAFAEARGFRDIEELRTFLAGYVTKDRDPQTLRDSPGLAPTYRSANWIEVMRLPGIGRKSLDEIVRWAMPDSYEEIDRLQNRLADAEADVVAAQQKVSEIRELIREARRRLPPS